MRCVVRYKGSCSTCTHSHHIEVPKHWGTEVMQCSKFKQLVDVTQPCDQWVSYRGNPEIHAMHARAFGWETASTGPC